MVPLKPSPSEAIQRRVPGKVYEPRHPGWGILPDEPARDLKVKDKAKFRKHGFKDSLIPFSKSSKGRNRPHLGPCEPTLSISCFPVAAGTPSQSLEFSLSEPHCRARSLKKTPLDCSISIIHWSKPGFPKLFPHHPPPKPQVLAESPGRSVVAVAAAKLTPRVLILDDEEQAGSIRSRARLQCLCSSNSARLCPSQTHLQLLS